MTNEEKWEMWRNKNAEIKKPYGGKSHKHIVWYEGVDRRKAFLDGLAEGGKELEKENEELKAQIEKMKSFIHSEIDFCVYCPLTNECRNEEGTCPYAYATEEEQKNLLMDFIQKRELTE